MKTKQKVTILISMLIILIFTSIISIIAITHAIKLSKYGYQDILSQVKNETFQHADNVVLNKDGWALDIQSLDNADEGIKLLAKDCKEYNIKLFVAYKVEEHQIIYAFVGVEENGAKYTVFCNQGTDRHIKFTRADYDEISDIFMAFTEEIENAD